MEADRNGIGTTVSISAVSVGGVLYNRRPLLANGRVAELHAPISPDTVVDAGPVNDTMTIVKFRRDGWPVHRRLLSFRHPWRGRSVLRVDLKRLYGKGDPSRRTGPWGTMSILLHLNGPCGDIDPVLMGDDRSLDIMTNRLTDGIHDQSQTRAETAAPETHPPLNPYRGTFRALRRETRLPAALERQQQALSKISRSVRRCSSPFRRRL